MGEQTSFGEVGKWGAIIVGMVLAVPVVIVLSNQAPSVLLAGVVLGFLAWAGVRSGVLATEEAGDDGATADPLTTLQDRYAAGELSEAEFERRLDRILQSDELVREAGDGRRTPDAASRTRGDGEVAARDREQATERE